MSKFLTKKGKLKKPVVEEIIYTFGSIPMTMLLFLSSCVFSALVVYSIVLEPLVLIFENGLINEFKFFLILSYGINASSTLIMFMFMVVALELWNKYIKIAEKREKKTQKHP
jgi:hypothetical protein